MLVTIWMCTQEWSLISSRAAALTFETCHQRLELVVAVDALDHRRELPVRRASGTLIRIWAIASVGVRRASRSASAETGSSMRPWVSASSGVSGSSSIGSIRRGAPRHRLDVRRRRVMNHAVARASRSNSSSPTISGGAG